MIGGVTPDRLNATSPPNAAAAAAAGTAVPFYHHPYHHLRSRQFVAAASGSLGSAATPVRSKQASSN